MPPNDKQTYSEDSPEGALSYRDAGVDIDAGNALVHAIKSVTERTNRPEVMSDLGGFGALCELPGKYEHPVLVAATDGVGTKLMLAQHRLLLQRKTTARFCQN